MGILRKIRNSIPEKIRVYKKRWYSDITVLDALLLSAMLGLAFLAEGAVLAGFSGIDSGSSTERRTGRAIAGSVCGALIASAATAAYAFLFLNSTPSMPPGFFRIWGIATMLSAGIAGFSVWFDDTRRLNKLSGKPPENACIMISGSEILYTDINEDGTIILMDNRNNSYADKEIEYLYLRNLSPSELRRKRLKAFGSWMFMELLITALPVYFFLHGDDARNMFDLILVSVTAGLGVSAFLFTSIHMSDWPYMPSEGLWMSRLLNRLNKNDTLNSELSKLRNAITELRKHRKNSYDIRDTNWSVSVQNEILKIGNHADSVEIMKLTNTLCSIDPLVKIEIKEEISELVGRVTETLEELVQKSLATEAAEPKSSVGRNIPVSGVYGNVRIAGR